jgi:hypothetical protein
MIIHVLMISISAVSQVVALDPEKSVLESTTEPILVGSFPPQISGQHDPQDELMQPTLGGITKPPSPCLAR